MPEHRLERTRRAYGPEDATWRAPHQNAAERLRHRCAGWNHATGYDPVLRAWRCACGQRVITVDAVANAGRLEDRIEDVTDLDEVADRGHLVANDPPLERIADEPEETEEQAHWNTIEADYWGV